MKQHTTGEWIAITLAIVIALAVFLLASLFFAPQSQPLPADFSEEALSEGFESIDPAAPETESEVTTEVTVETEIEFAQ